MSVLYVLFVSSYRGIARESYDKSPEKVYSRFDFAKARGAPVREYRDSRIKKNTVFDFKLLSIYIRTLLRCISTKTTKLSEIKVLCTRLCKFPRNTPQGSKMPNGCWLMSGTIFAFFALWLLVAVSYITGGSSFWQHSRQLRTVVYFLCCVQFNEYTHTHTHTNTQPFFL